MPSFSGSNADMQMTSFTRRRIKVWASLAALAVGTLAQRGCLGDIQRELEVVFALDATENLFLVRDSFLVNTLGLWVTRVFN